LYLQVFSGEGNHLVYCFLFICSSSSRVVTPSGQTSGRRGKWSINIMKLILLLVPISYAVAKTHDKLLTLAKGWNTKLRFRMFLFASSLVLVLEVFCGRTVGPLLMPTNCTHFKSSSTHRRPERLNCVVILSGRTTLMDFNRGIQRTVCVSSNIQNFIHVLSHAISGIIHHIRVLLLFLWSLEQSVFSLSFYSSRSRWPSGLKCGLRPLASWDWGFESRQGHGCLSVSYACCVLSGRGLWDGSIPSPEES
jgi:hypothetical protein